MDQLLDMETLKKLTPEQQNQVIAGVKQQAAIANAQNLITVSSYIGFNVSEYARRNFITFII